VATEELDRRAVAEAAILRATSELIEEGSSFARLSVDAIATRAGIGRTAFYFYFRDKRELLMRLTQEAAAKLFAESDRWFHGDADMRDSFEQAVQLYLEHAAVLRVVTEAAGYDEEVRAFWQRVVGRFVDATTERIERDQAAGFAEPVPARETASALIWMCERRLYQFARDEPDGDPAALVDALAGVMLRAIYGRLPG
jgi:AcrR family transcriptional regulator